MPHPAPPATLPAAVLWDMDGTLVDTEPYWIAAEHELVAEHGGTWTHAQALQLVGNPLEVSAAVLRDAGVDLPVAQIVERLLTRVTAQVRDDVPWRPGARALLDALAAADVPCALVTMSYTVLAEAVTAHVPGAFATLVTGDQVARGKPDPEPYLVAARRLGVRPSECVAIEDSPTGLTSALAAGARTLGVEAVLPIEAREGLSRAASLTDVDLAFLRRMAAGEVLDLV
ncbi:HAD superfamily hydrolase (TIGR01509 family) [Isoptericola sp. CG 20/1183]|uniref:HAD superfamily hydrolase (TIGR01509 family) n=1 Tax=Isoptericola halotolerans TaxID=300560 RepID=A0ABX5EAD0_9MICO|nr:MULTISPECIES: HAD family phosphatase [Isoptericola]PRZ03431.1 HAD superfamily hydrolase (TIGR01509 family) [Isoptericola sp. CG 20/1183]PRZ03718.1 HAD superfamily hydrolase (TIGR01509 family) [Isoptericola halotolerans]